jgi:hypothetical protein
MNGQHTGWRPPRRFSVTVQRLARPPTPWTWAIYEEDVADPFHRSSRSYRSAEEAWAVGRAMLTRMTGPTHRTRAGGSRSEVPEGVSIPS